MYQHMLVVLTSSHSHTSFLGCVACMIDAACCYTCCKHVLGVLGTRLSCAKMAEPIEMPFGGRIHVGPKYSVFDDGV